METDADERAPAAARLAVAPERSASITDGASEQVVLGTVRQPEPGMLNEMLGEDERELNASQFILFGNVDADGRVSSSSLVEEEEPGNFSVYELDGEQLNALAESPYFEAAVTLERGSSGEITVRDSRTLEGSEAAEVMSLAGVDAANEGIGNRYVGPIVAQGEDDTLVQRVGEDFVSHRADQLEGVIIDPDRPLEISYEFDGASVSTLDREQDVSLGR